MKIHTTLLSGAGNTFHILSDQAGSFFADSPEKRKILARDICEKTPADGFIYLKKLESGSFNWFFYNKDGSDAEMCGNATRCVGYFVRNIMSDSEAKWTLQTAAGVITIASLSENLFQVIMTPIQVLKSDLGFFCNTGVPHLVIEVESLATAKLIKAQAQSLRQHESFGPAGTNVTYVQKLMDPKSVKAVSFERGVEDFTEACGTGAVAAAAYNLKKYSVVETNVEMPGGLLIMNLADLNKPKMNGPATFLGSYDYEYKF